MRCLEREPIIFFQGNLVLINFAHFCQHRVGILFFTTIACSVKWHPFKNVSTDVMTRENRNLTTIYIRSNDTKGNMLR